jgi:hypothetical protein
MTVRGELNPNADVTDCVTDAATPKVLSPDFGAAESCSTGKPSNVRFVVSVAVVLFSMVFNGTIYGYTSPGAYPTKSYKYWVYKYL